MYILDLSRPLSKWRVIANVACFLAAIVSPSISFAITKAECEQIKSQLLVKLDLIDRDVASISNTVSTILDTVGYGSGTYFEYIDSNGDRHFWNTSLIPINDRSGTPIGTIGGLVIFPLEDSQLKIGNISQKSSEIRSLINSIQCEDTEQCNCAEQLALIAQQIDALYSTLSLQYETLQEVNLYLDYFYSDFTTYSEEVLQNLSTITNGLFTWKKNYMTERNFDRYRFLTTLKTGLHSPGSTIFQNIGVNLYGPFDSFAIFKSSTLSDVLRYSAYFNWGALNSLNNYSYTNLFLSSSLHEVISSNIPVVPTFLKSLDRSPLDRVSGNYFAHLTNEYLATFSASSPNTNWFRRVEILLASLAFRETGHQDELDEIEEDLPDGSSLESLESALDSSEMFDVDIGSQFLEHAPSLPQFGSQLPQTLVITIPSFGGNDSQSASTALSIDIDVNSISPICDAVRACFRFLWWGLVALLVFILGRWFLRGCSLAFRLIQGIHFS